MDLALTRVMSQMAELGLKPLPVKPGEKHPYIEWTKYRDRPSWPALASHFKPGIGIWTPLGQATGWIVLDLDNAAALSLWTKRLSGLHSTAGIATTRKGVHWYFKIPAGVPWAGWTWRSDPEAVELDAHYEVLADGNGVMTPPSHHADDPSFQYEWDVWPDPTIMAPELLRKPKERQRGAITTGMLSQLLRDPPREGGRDVWMASVAGHLAKWLPHEDAYLSLLHLINDALPEPLEADEIDKKRGIWLKEHEKAYRDYEEDAGYLAGTGVTLMTECTAGQDAPNYGAEWADFDIKAIGKMDTDDRLIYVVDFHHKSGFIRRNMQLDPRIFSQANTMTAWLVSQGGTVMPPRNDAHQNHNAAARLFRYIRAQDPPAFSTVDHLGWSDAGFVTHEGTLRPSGLVTDNGVRPQPGLTGVVQYRYGEVPEEEALDVLRAVLTFQDEQVTSVFAAWWAMAILKGQYKTPLFPFMAIEAGSGSGKTTGFFAMMVQLIGNAEGHGQSTIAAMRDSVSGHRNGIVWIDDVSDPAAVADIIRQATSEGSRSKKSTDRTKTESMTLRSPILISGEDLGTMMDEKAMIERAVQLDVPSPIDRMSLIDPTRPQWDDIKALNVRYEDDLTRVAGTLVRLVLGNATLLPQLPELKVGNSRHADKLAILRMGARIVSAVTGDPTHVTRVDEWVQAQADPGEYNTVILRVIPWALMDLSYPSTALYHQPAFTDYNGIVWVSPERLAMKWHNRSNLSTRDRGLGSERNIREQLKKAGSGASKNHKIEPGDGAPVRRYIACTPDASAVVRKLMGESADDKTP